MKMRCEEWGRLVGIRVDIRKGNKHIRTGIVDDVMPDGSAVWLAADPSHGRSFFSADDGFEVWISPRDLPDGLYSHMVCGHPGLYPLF